MLCFAKNSVSITALFPLQKSFLRCCRGCRARTCLTLRVWLDGPDSLEARGGGRRGRGVRERETAREFEARQALEKGLNDGGDRSVAFGTPDADVMVGFVVDGYGDISHIFSSRETVLQSVLVSYKAIVREEVVIFGKGKKQTWDGTFPCSRRQTRLIFYCRA
jgi:hypothetical protein